MAQISNITVCEHGVTVSADISELDDPVAAGRRLLVTCRAISQGQAAPPTDTSNPQTPASGRRPQPASGRPASPAQRRYIASLCDNDPQRIGRLLEAHGVATLDELPSRAAHQVIDSLKGGS